MDNVTNRPEKYRIILEGGSGEIEEKKSRFICTVRPVHSEAEASAFIEEMKKKYWDARHNCSAFVLGEKQNLTRCSDDGEPSGTAGRPMLEVLLGEGVTDVAAVVTRYFGGTLLGTGGLVRAYTQAVKAGIDASQTGYMVLGRQWRFHTDYNGIGKIQYVLSQMGLVPADTVYGVDVEVVINVPVGLTGKLRKELTEVTLGQIQIEESDEEYFIEK